MLKKILGLFARKNGERHRAELAAYPEPFRSAMLSGENCDRISGGVGEFGRSPGNPVPVNGAIGEVKYLNSLRVKGGLGLIYHRVGSVPSPIGKSQVDIFETVSADGACWDVLALDMYHPRRSTAAPDGYEIAPYHPTYSEMPIGFGVTVNAGSFPEDLPGILASHGSLGAAIAKRLRGILDGGSFARPPEQLARLRALGGRQSAEDDASFTVLGVSLGKAHFPKLYSMFRTSPENLEAQLQSIADAWHEGDVTCAARALESDL